MDIFERPEIYEAFLRVAGAMEAYSAAMVEVIAATKRSKTAISEFKKAENVYNERTKELQTLIDEIKGDET